MIRLAFGLAVVVTILAAPLGASAQPATRVSRVGVLMGGAPGDARVLLDPLRQGLRDLGYVEGRTLVVEPRFAEGRLERHADLAAELARLPVDVIVAPGTAAAQAARKATTTIPIVIVTAGNPVDRILKGARPADLPVERPTKFELICQPQGREGARPDDPAIAAAAGRPGDGVSHGRAGGRDEPGACLQCTAGE